MSNNHYAHHNIKDQIDRMVSYIYELEDKINDLYVAADFGCKDCVKHERELHTLICQIDNDRAKLKQFELLQQRVRDVVHDMLERRHTQLINENIDELADASNYDDYMCDDDESDDAAHLRAAGDAAFGRDADADSDHSPDPSFDAGFDAGYAAAVEDRRYAQRLSK